jgi:DNA-binding XRE family transcriptional regulator
MKLNKQNAILKIGKKDLVINMPITVNGHTLKTFDDTWNDPNFLTPTEKEIIDFKVQLFGALLEAREKEGLTQAELAKKANMTQPEIARLEKPDANPKIDTLLRATVPMGYRLKLERIAKPLNP